METKILAYNNTWIQSWLVRPERLILGFAMALFAIRIFYSNIFVSLSTAMGKRCSDDRENEEELPSFLLLTLDDSRQNEFVDEISCYLLT